MLTALSAKKARLIERARIIQRIRAFFIDGDFLEIDAPQRIPVNAPESQILPISSGEWQLQTSPELAMKRLLAAGYQQIFQISHCWRDEERGSRHLPEFSLLEWYRSSCDYRQLMQDCEELLKALLPQKNLNYQGHSICLDQPFEHLSVEQAFAQFTDTNPLQALNNDSFDELIAFTIEPQLGLTRPTILYDYPLQLGALARPKPGQPQLAERFELYIAGLELANAFSELSDPAEQRRRFECDAQLLAEKTGQAPKLPLPFLRDLKQMPEAAGIALGLDRLVMLLTNATNIDQVVAFPPEDL